MVGAVHCSAGSFQAGDVLMSHEAKDLAPRTPASAGAMPTLGA